MSSKTKDLRSMDETVVSEALTRQVATIMLGGSSVADCAKRLSISPNAVRTITASDRYKDIVAKVSKESLGPALAQTLAMMTALGPKAVKLVEKAIDDALDGTGSMRDGLDAVGKVHKAMGLGSDDRPQQDTSITVIMPGAAEPQTIEVQSETQD